MSTNNFADNIAWTDDMLYLLSDALSVELLCEDSPVLISALSFDETTGQYEFCAQNEERTRCETGTCGIDFGGDTPYPVNIEHNERLNPNNRVFLCGFTRQEEFFTQRNKPLAIPS